MRGMPFACIARSAMHPLPISATAKSGWTIADYGLPTLEMATLSHNATMRSVRRVWAVRSAVILQLQHLRYLRWQVACATRVRRRPMASVLWTHVRGTDAKPCAARVHRRSTNADALGDHPRHRTHYWYQCPGRVPQALVPMSGPGQACPNNYIEDKYWKLHFELNFKNKQVLKTILEKISLFF